MAANGNAAASHKSSLHYISAATGALRRRLEAMRDGRTTEEGGVTTLEDDEAVIAEAAMGEVRSLMAQLKPLASVASEFKVKWDRQKAALIEQRRSEIAAHLHHESEAVSHQAELAMQEEVRAINHASEQAAREAADSMVKCHQPQLEDAVADWREEVKGSDAVRMADVDKALRHALQRVATWTVEEEKHIMQSWSQELARAVTTAHVMDEESLAAAEDTQIARKSVLDSAIQRHWRGLQACRAELQDRISEKSEALQEEKAVRKRPAGHAAIMAAQIGKASRNRIALAKSEAQAAMDAHRQTAAAQLDTAANKQIIRMGAYEEALGEVGPDILERLDHELARIRIEHKDTLDEIKRRARGPDSDSAESAGGSPSRRRSDGSRDTAKGGSQLIGGRGRAGLRGSAASRKSVIPGSANVPRASVFQYNAERELPDSAPGSPCDQLDLSPNSQQDLGGDDSASECSDRARFLAEEARQKRAEQCVRLRQQLEATQAGLLKGEWYGEWRRGLAEAVNLGRAKMRDAEAALEGQAGVLQSREKTNEDMQHFSSAFMELAQHTKSYATSAREEMTKIRNAKAGLAMTRADYLRDLMHRYEQDAPSAERDALPYVSKLSRETEIVIEVGRAIQRGSDRFPVAVVAGAWRRAIAAALQLLKRLWDSAGAPLDEQRAFMNKVLAIMARTPEGYKLLDQAVPRS